MNLLRAGRIFVFEPPPGVKANMLRTFSSIPVARMCKVTSIGTMKHYRLSHQTLPLPSVIIQFFFPHRLLTSVPVCTSCWPGSTLSSKSVCATHHSAGPKSTSLESLTCALPATPWTPGLMTLLRFGCCYRNNTALEQRLHKNDLFFVETAFSSNNRIL